MFILSVQFPVMSGRSLDVELTVFDEEGRPFDNFTSLSLKWGSSDTKIVQTPVAGDLNHHGNRAIMSVPLTHVISSVELKVTSESYVQSILAEEKVVPSQQSFTAVSARLGLLLRKAPTLLPTSLVIFNHPENEVRITHKLHVCVCVCVCVCAYVCACMHVCACMCVRVRAYSYT